MSRPASLSVIPVAVCLFVSANGQQPKQTSPAIDESAVHKQFGPEFTLIPDLGRLVRIGVETCAGEKEEGGYRHLRRGGWGRREVRYLLRRQADKYRPLGASID